MLTGFQQRFFLFFVFFIHNFLIIFYFSFSQCKKHKPINFYSKKNITSGPDVNTKFNTYAISNSKKTDNKFIKVNNKHSLVIVLIHGLGDTADTEEDPGLVKLKNELSKRFKKKQPVC